jgi:hypothetical protein
MKKKFCLQIEEPGHNLANKHKHGWLAQLRKSCTNFCFSIRLDTPSFRPAKKIVSTFFQFIYPKDRKANSFMAADAVYVVDAKDF